jgi:hypothetical protein
MIQFGECEQDADVQPPPYTRTGSGTGLEEPLSQLNIDRREGADLGLTAGMNPVRIC